MNSDQFAKLLAARLAEHQSRGLVDAATGLHDVVIHGRIDLLAVAEDVLFGTLREMRPARRSWAPWFTGTIDARHKADRQVRARARLAEKAECGATVANAAIARLRLRDLDL